MYGSPTGSDHSFHGLPGKCGKDRAGAPHPLPANLLLPQWIATHWPKYEEGGRSVGGTADRADWRVARTVFVADDEETARSYGKGHKDSPYRYYYGKMLHKMRILGRLNPFKEDQDMPDEDVTLERVLDALVIAGTAEQVADQISKLNDEVGGFGELV
ncbi:alkanesulfonate monooxygenase SsuD/methylene tetrahydromethanopterin reductase-like flavin-dependent oxidoreductase (luciferase family) [Saccharomonospora amisosensis]|uniref:Alkanesulfonate monooxygenase SsuD/methylene tetrahydromethanopterin reductase-like flavin-dependent oxidoreductase (Luciferase family) n=1 Tax=Saccharomonospora amisosensis TaxID=1128677 RepID=A0A7X5URT0_9PSEU|nr:LLM class flavin-dependent oxidoreductase [Saccharomonospora amisosensis]NIJ13024.1 alkanesulfonate monooxygenase SsuD/methylene tetrahydromethanopterin reductase-like flavin-dependent oxidoreductase (luciferase family) [Saccharomonospora amisosensis]